MATKKETKTKIETISFTNPKHASHMFSAFAELRDMEEFCDIKVETSVDEIPAHRVVLAACSPHFREALKDIDESEESCAVPEECDSKVVAAVINYYYTGRLEIDSKLLPETLKTARFFQNTDILDRLEDLVVKDLSVENCLDYCSKAEECEMKSLQKTVIRYISWHLMELVEHEDWVKLPKSTIISLVSNDVLNIEKEEDVYEALWKWFKYDENNRKVDCQEVFQNVRFFQVSDPKFLTDRVVPDLAKDIGVCKDEIKQAIVYQSSDKAKRQAMDAQLKHRYPSKVIYMFDSKATKVEKYDPIRVECIQERRILDSRDISSIEGHKTAIVVNNELYIVSSAKVEKFNKLSLSWEKNAKGVSTRESAICTDEENIYVVGGRDQPTAVKCFNVLTMTWSQLPDMPEGRRSAGAVARDGRIYVMGGYGVDEPLATTFRFSNRAGKWKKLVNMNSVRFGMQALIIRSQIFVIGGRDNSGTFKSIETFDLDSSKEAWVEFKHDMVRPRNEFGAIYNGQLWCLGGRGENSIERFDFSCNTWELLGKMGDVRYGMSCVLYSLF